ncbi:MAG TPA: hypothetical protein VF204_04365 [Streptosporangiaceae bacterium]
MSTPRRARRIDGRAIAARLRAQAAEVTQAAAALTPGPGGVGPVTTAQLLRQTAAAAWRAETSRIES